MVGETPPRDSDDERDDLAALDFAVAESGQIESDLDATRRLRRAGTRAEERTSHRGVPAFAVTNPPGTVTVTAYLDGRVNQVDLSPKVTEMTETDLAEEIVVIAGLATADARSAQYTYMLEGMRGRAMTMSRPATSSPATWICPPRTRPKPLGASCSRQDMQVSHD